MRESPSIPIIKELLIQGAVVKAYDPIANNAAHKVFGDENIVYCSDLKNALNNVEAVLIISKCQEFLELPTALTRFRNPPLVIDGRRIINKHTVDRYEGIGLYSELDK